MYLYVTYLLLCTILMICRLCSFFFFNYTATTEIYTYLHTLSLHDALPIYTDYYNLMFLVDERGRKQGEGFQIAKEAIDYLTEVVRSEEHTSELQSLMRISYAVFCLKKKT